jgi:hypothetical protein
LNILQFNLNTIVVTTNQLFIKMIKKTTVLLLSFLLLSCSLKKKEPQPKIIPEAKFVAILVDYHLAQGLSSSYLLRQKLKNYKTLSLTDSVLAANGCTRTIFDSTISYYSKDVDKFGHIYDKVLNELNKMQAKAKDKGVKPVKAKPNIKK